MDLKKYKPYPGEYWQLIDTQAPYSVQVMMLEITKGLQQFTLPVRVVLIKRRPFATLLEDQLIHHGIKYSYLDDIYYLAQRSAPPNNSWLSLYVACQYFQPILLHSHCINSNLLGKSVTPFIRALSYINSPPNYIDPLLLTSGLTTVKAPNRTVKLVSSQPFENSSKPQDRSTNSKVAHYCDRFSQWLASATLSFKAQHSHLTTEPCLPYLSLPPFVMLNALSRATGHHIAFISTNSQQKNSVSQTIQTIKSSHACFSALHYYRSDDTQAYTPSYEVIEQHIPCGTTPKVRSHTLDWSYIHALVIDIHSELDEILILEAMGRCVPIIAFNNEKARHYCGEKHDYLYNNERELIKRVAKWIETDPHQQQFLKRQARKRVLAHFSSQKVIPKLLKIYQLGNN